MHKNFPIFIVIASSGRPDALEELLDDLDRQTLTPAKIILSVCSHDDLPPHLDRWNNIVIEMGPRGSCCQRNRALDRIDDFSGAVMFLDDDYVPSRYAVEAATHVFQTKKCVLGIEGTLVADGIHGPGLSRLESMALIEESDKSLNPKDTDSLGPERYGLYGCNMAFRGAAIAAIRFDENLPLYGWQEDIDFSRRAVGTGILVQIKTWRGVHRGVKSGRVSGKKFGYSQVANPLYLFNKKTMSFRIAIRMITRNIIANIVKSLIHDPWVDRRGRLLGNAIAVWDLLCRRLSTLRVIKL